MTLQDLKDNIEARPKKKESKLAAIVCNHELENGIKYDVVKKEYVKI